MLAPSPLGLPAVDEEIADAASTTDGQLLAVVSGPPFLWWLSADSIVRRVPRGLGPGDLLAPWTLVRDAATGSAWGVRDVGRMLLVAIDTTLGSVEIEPRLAARPLVQDIREAARIRPFAAFRTTSGFLYSDYPSMRGGSKDFRDLAIFDLDTTGGIRDTVWRQGAPAPDDVDANAWLGTHLPLWWACGEREIAVLDAATWQLRWLAPNRSGRGTWTTTDSAALPWPRVPLSDAEARRFIVDEAFRVARREGAVDSAAVLQRTARLAERRDAIIARTHPPAGFLTCLPDGRVLLRQFAFGQESREWAVTARDGRSVRFLVRDDVLPFGPRGAALLVASRNAAGALVLATLIPPAP